MVNLQFKKACLIMIIAFSYISSNNHKESIKDIVSDYENPQEINIEIIEEPIISNEENTEENMEQILEDNEEIENTTEETIEEITEEIIEIIKFNPNGLLLNYGVANEEVSRIKSFLNIKGYNVTEGYLYDYETKQIVADYQSKNGLIADGIIGINTYAKINEDMEINKISIKKWQLDENIILPQELLLINKSNNTLYHIKEKKIIERYPIATGKSIEYTPEGKFTIVNKYVNPYWGGAGRNKPVRGGAPNNPLGKRWMGLSIKGGGTYGIHGNSNERSIGTYASLGCVRMHNKDVEYLFDIISLGTEVWIGTEELINTFLNTINLD